MKNYEADLTALVDTDHEDGEYTLRYLVYGDPASPESVLGEGEERFRYHGPEVRFRVARGLSYDDGITARLVTPRELQEVRDAEEEGR